MPPQLIPPAIHHVSAPPSMPATYATPVVATCDPIFHHVRLHNCLLLKGVLESPSFDISAGLAQACPGTAIDGNAVASMWLQKLMRMRGGGAHENEGAHDVLRNLGDRLRAKRQATSQKMAIGSRRAVLWDSIAPRSQEFQARKTWLGAINTRSNKEPFACTMSLVLLPSRSDMTAFRRLRR